MNTSPSLCLFNSIHSWLVVWNHGILFSIYWEFHNPNWLSLHHFQKGRSTTNQTLILRSESIRCQSIRQAVEPGHIFWVAPSGGRDRRPCYGGWGPAQNGPKRTGELTVNRGKPNKAPTLEGFESHFFGIGEGLWHWVYHISYPSKCG
jgi:hypothetical protein